MTSAKQIHAPPYADWKCIMTPGNTFMLELAFRTFVKRGDYILIEQYTYPSCLETAKPLGARFVAISMDKDGLLPEDLDRVVSSWDASIMGAERPKVLYIIPTGQNPTGSTLSEKRREEIYAICCKHDIYILEDDPYYYIQMRAAYETSTSFSNAPTALVRSFLSLDTQGRVMRMDSFSKIMSAGSRLGWVTASEQVIERITRAHEVSIQNPSGFAQIIVFRILQEKWLHEGFSVWLKYLQNEYALRRDMMMKLCADLLPEHLVSWSIPSAGFFVSCKDSSCFEPS